MRVIFLFLFFISFISQGQSIEENTSRLANSDQVRDGRFSFYAVDLASGKSIVSHDIDRKMSPASTMKLLTTYAALDILGVDFQFKTRVGYQGEIDEQGTLHGNVLIIAGGDPVLDAEVFQKNYGDGSPFTSQILKALQERGVKKIEGRVLIDESYYSGIDVPDEWTWQDMGNYYGAGAHAFTFNENRFNIYFKSGSQPGALTRIVRTEAVLKSTSPINEVRSAAINSDQAYVYAAPKSDRMTVHGEIPLNKSEFKVKAAMSNPAAEFEARLEQAFIASGLRYEKKEIEIKDRSDDGSPSMTEILVMESPKLIEITAYTNLKSNNLFAEHLLRQIARKRTGEGSFNKGVEVIEEWIQKKSISTRGLDVKDGSGLSRANLVSARLMLDLLESLSKETYFDEFMRALPCAGKSGSMRRIGAGTAISDRMFAKTGYIEGVRAYAGYLEKKEGGLISFCIMANDYEMNASAMRKEMTKLMVQLSQVESPKLLSPKK
jgi:D-alanyl-D-alanine carboxypeptidase/D-alanyl-D-alanine-endopeptidase (penicillin-binding protein 4)